MLKMHKSVFVYIIIILITIIIIIIISDHYFAIWFQEHKLGWLQQCRALSKQLFCAILFPFVNKCGRSKFYRFCLKAIYLRGN